MNSSKEVEDTSGWHTIYPQYINSNRSIYFGRRLAKSECVSDPKCQEIKDVLDSNHLFKCSMNLNKCYSRELDKESVINRGFVKYKLINQNDVNSKEFENKKNVLKYVSKMIPKLKSRNKSNQNEQQINQNVVNKKKKSKK